MAFSIAPPADPVLLRQTVHYRGWMPLWTVLVPLPDVIDPPEAKLP